MAEQCELNGEAQTIGFTPPPRHEVLVGPGEGVVPRQSIRITGHAEQQPAFLIGQQLSTRHASLLFVPEPSIMIVDGNRLLDVFCGRKCDDARVPSSWSTERTVGRRYGRHPGLRAGLDQ